MKRLLFIFILFFSINVYALEKKEVIFHKCVDGDTAWFIDDGKEFKYRFLAIDTPETLHPTKQGGIIGANASEFTCNLLKEASIIEIEYDSNSAKVDKYKRELVWVFIDGELLQEKLIEKGYAKIEYIYGDYKYLSILKDKETISKEEKIGIWGNIFTVTFKYKNKMYVEEVIEGSIIKPIEVDKEDRKDFKGWFYNDKIFDFNREINEDIELIGKYKENTLIFRLIMTIIFLMILYFIDKKEFNKQTRKIKRRLIQ